MSTLKDYAENFLETVTSLTDSSFHLGVSAIHNLMHTVGVKEQELTKDQLKESLMPVRDLYSKSPFAWLLQNWPQGYSSDYLTIEYICDVINKATPNTAAYFLEQHAFTSRIAQQHRNKVQLQSQKIIECINENVAPKILIVGCGDARDIQMFQNLMKGKAYTLYLNEMDADALTFAKSKLDSEIMKQTNWVNKNILSYVKELANAELHFDLILFGGIFDYLTDKQIMFVLKNQYTNNLNKNGHMFYTNIAENNPYRCWIEYVTNWKLIERCFDLNINLCVKSGIPFGRVSNARDNTNLTYLVTINNLTNSANSVEFL